MQPECSCVLCRKAYCQVVSPSTDIREQQVTKDQLRYLDMSRAELIHEYRQILEEKRIPKGSESPLPIKGVCAACEDDFVRQVTITSLLFEDLVKKNPNNPEQALETVLDELVRNTPLANYEVH